MDDSDFDDFDLFDAEFCTDPFTTFDAMRDRCPVARSERWGGSWMVSRYEEINAIAHDPARFSSRVLETTGPIPEEGSGLFFPPISTDPPDHAEQRRILLPFFSPQSVAKLEDVARVTARDHAEAFRDAGGGDAVAAFAHHIPVNVITTMIGVPPEDSPQFHDWINDVLVIGPQDYEVRGRGLKSLLRYFEATIPTRRDDRRDDLMSVLLDAEIDGQPLSDRHIAGTGLLLIIAGIDTTLNGIATAIWHLATHPADRLRLLADPHVMPLAIEEFLRAYAPIAIGRVLTEDVSMCQRDMKAGDRVILPWVAANRDPAVFDDADRFVIDREANRHLAFGAGVHRCLGSNLARMEMRVALEEWLRAVPDFELTGEVEWTGANVRGPKRVDLRVMASVVGELDAAG